MVKEKVLNVIWANIAKEQLKDIYQYIKKDSEKSAKQVRNTILASTQNLSRLTTIYKTDELKSNNNGSYRAYVIYNYRISYKIEIDTILILRIRHTSREPLNY